MKAVLLGVGLSLGGVAVGFVAGRGSAPLLVQAQGAQTQQAQAEPQQAPDDPRELVPLVPGRRPGDGPGQGQRPQPGQGQQPGKCTVLQFKNGQFYQLVPGQNGQQPGPGTGDAPGGQPGGDNELIPVQPVTPGDQNAPFSLPFSSDPVHG